MAANMAALDELGMHLQSLQALKAPGVTPTKVKAITKLCVDNIQVCDSVALFQTFHSYRIPTKALLLL